MRLALEPFPGHTITLRKGPAEAASNVALLNPKLIISPLQVHVAACRAMASLPNLKTKSLANELVHCLSATTNVQAFLSFLDLRIHEHLQGHR